MNAHLYYDQIFFAKMAVHALHGIPGIGHARLLAIINLQPQPVKPPGQLPTAVHVSASVLDGNGTSHIASCEPAMVRWDAGTTSMHLHASVSFQTLALLNEARKSARDDVFLLYRFELHLDGPAGWWSHQQVDLKYRIAGSDWLALLEAAQFSLFRSIELPVDGYLVPTGLAQASAHYRGAVEKLARCEWDNAIGDAREVFNELDKAIGNVETKTAWNDLATDATRKGMGFEQRLAVIRMVARHATHGVHHGETGRRPEEARYVVELAGIAMKYYAEKLRS